MEPADGIRRLGFKRWYERQLIEGHVYLVTALLAGITVAACAEGLSFREDPARASTMLAVMFLCGGLVWFSWTRFSTLLVRAERYGDKSTCPSCKTYARFELVSVQGRGDDDPLLRVRCRKCGADWTLP